MAVPAAAQSALEGVVTRIVDGDTIHVDLGGRVETVRYIGVNTPELLHPRKGEEPGGRAAAAVNRALVGDRHVRLELDAQARDRHGRLLAQVMTVPPNVRHQPLFLRLQREAREAGRGLWADSVPTAR